MTFLSVLSCGAAYALPVGNPSDASLLVDGLLWEGHCTEICNPCTSICDAISVRAGFYGDYVFNRHLEIDRSDVDDNDDTGPSIEHTQLYTNAGLIAVNFYDRIDVFSTLGITNMYIDSNLFRFVEGTATATAAVNGERFTLQAGSDFSWSVGARGTLFETGCTSLGIEGQYFSWNPDIMRITVAENFSTYPDNSLGIHYEEWQFGVGVAHRIHIFVPYIAVKWANARVDFGNARLPIPIGPGPTRPLAHIHLRDLQEHKSWGYAVGVSIIDCEKMSATVEGRFADEKAVHVNSQIRF